MKFSDGTYAPGPSAILGILNTDLSKWANSLCLKGIKIEDEQDKVQKTGTYIHDIIESHITQTDIDTSNWNTAYLEVAENVFFNKYLTWEKDHKLECVYTEKEFVSDKLGYGGKIDCLAYLDGELTLIDFKTSKAVTKHHLMQLSAYVQLLREYDINVEKALIIDIPKDTTTPIIVKELDMNEVPIYTCVFNKIVETYWLLKDFKYFEK